MNNNINAKLQTAFFAKNARQNALFVVITEVDIMEYIGPG